MILFSLILQIPWQCQNKKDSEIPIVLIHGTLNNASRMNTIKEVLQEKYPDRDIIVTDAYLMITSFLDNGERLASYTVKQIQDGILKLSSENNVNGNSTIEYNCIDILGHSQGGFMGRVFIQLYSGNPGPGGSYPAVRRFISLAGVQAGFHCPDSGEYKGVSKFCKGLQGVPESLIKSRLMSWFFTALTYFRDPRDPTLWPVSINGTNSTMNNLHPDLKLQNMREVEMKKLVYKTNVVGEGREKMESLELLVAFGSSGDKTLSPWQTSIFAFFDTSGVNVVPMNQTADYQVNSYGLFTLNQNTSANSNQKRLIRRETQNMSHIAFRNDRDFIATCVAPLFANKTLSQLINSINNTICGSEPTNW